MSALFEKASADTTPQKIQESVSIKRIIYVLEYYSKWLTEQTNQNDLSTYQSLVYMNDDQNTSYNITNNDNDKKENKKEKDGIFEWIASLSKTYNLTKLLDDFHYILFFHSSPDSQDFEQLTNYIKSSLLKKNKNDTNIDIDQSIQLIRNNRNRYKYSQNDNLRVSTYCGYSENQEIVTQQILDSIYSFLLFTFDFGYRLTQKQKEALDDIDNDDSDDLLDKKFKFIYDTVSKNKLYAMYKNTSKDDEDDDKKDVDSNVFDSGTQFYYWQNKGKGKENKWFIKAKYDTFKDEIINNKFGLNKDQWDDIMIKAKSLLETNMAKVLKATSYYEEEYEIKHRAPVSIQHIISLLLYTNFRVKI